MADDDLPGFDDEPEDQERQPKKGTQRRGTPKGSALALVALARAPAGWG